MEPAGKDDAAGMPAGRRWPAALTLWCAILLAVIDGSIANVALPSIATDLHASASGSIWVVNAYQLAIVVTLLPLASLAEIVGYRRVYLAGLALFTAASAGCALAGSLPALAAARAVQGMGAAGIMCINAALLRVVFPPERLGRAIATNAMFVALGSAAGPAIAGGVLAVAHWPVLFLVNVPAGIAILAVGRRTLPASPLADRAFDAGSAVLNVVAFLGLAGGIDLAMRGIALAGGAGLAGGAAALALLVRRQLGRSGPLLPLDLLAIREFRLAIGVSSLSFLAAAAALVSLPFLLERGLHRGSVATGALMTAWPAAVMVAAPLVGRLADRVGTGPPATVGLAILATGLWLLAGIGAGASDRDILWRLAVAGLGFAMFQAPNNRAMLGAAPTARSGGASGLLAMARLTGQTGGALAVSVGFAGGTGGLAQAREVLEFAGGVACAAGAVSLVRLVRTGRGRVQPGPSSRQAATPSSTQAAISVVPPIGASGPSETSRTDRA